MGITPRLETLLAALALGVAVVVIVISPVILAAPNPLSIPSAVIVAVGSSGALAGGRWGTQPTAER